LHGQPWCQTGGRRQRDAEAQYWRGCWKRQRQYTARVTFKNSAGQNAGAGRARPIVDSILRSLRADRKTEANAVGGQSLHRLGGQFVKGQGDRTCRACDDAAQCSAYCCCNHAFLVHALLLFWSGYRGAIS
jgi:hypothetical protein